MQSSTSSRASSPRTRLAEAHKPCVSRIDPRIPIYRPSDTMEPRILGALVYAVGLTEEDMDKPQIGISPIWWEGNPCNVHLCEHNLPLWAAEPAPARNERVNVGGNQVIRTRRVSRGYLGIKTQPSLLCVDCEFRHVDEREKMLLPVTVNWRFANSAARDDQFENRSNPNPIPGIQTGLFISTGRCLRRTMSAALGDPFLLSSYDVSKRFASSSSSHSNVYVTHHRARAGEGYATIAVHGDGVHVLDVSDMHLVHSYALGPSTSFACPAVSRTHAQNELNVWTTYAAIQDAPELKPEEKGKTIWAWNETLSGETSGKSQKTSVVMPHRVAKILYAEELPSRVILVSPEGDLTLADEELHVLTSKAYPHPTAALQRSFVLPKSSPLSSQSDSPSHSATVLSFISHEGRTRLYIAALNDQGVDLIYDDVLPTTSTDVVDVSCSPEGHISLLLRSGSWESYLLQKAHQKIVVKQLAPPIRIQKLSFASSTSQLNERTLNEISLLSLGSSFVLFSAITSQSPELVLLLWDLQYSVVLASHSLPIPSTLAHSKEGVTMELVLGSSSQALLSLSPKTPKPSSQSRSSVLAVPINVPERSTIAQAMGRAADTAKWTTQPSTSSAADLEKVGLDGSRRNLLQKVRAAIEQDRPEAADTLFLEWAQRETAARAKIAKQPSQTQAIEHGPEFSREFVRRLLDAVLQPSLPAASYSPKTIEYLLKHRAVSWTMLDVSLFTLLQARKDWHAVQLALQNVIDIPEQEVISLLNTVVTIHRRDKNADANSMQVDSVPSDCPSVPAILSLVVTYPTSSVPMRLAIRDRLSDAENIVGVLEVLEGWIATWSKQDMSLALNRTKTPDIPPFDKVVDFLRHILDASFLTLLQYAPSHRLLRHLHAHLEPEVAFVDEVEQLRGPLEPFSRAQAKAAADAAQGPRKDTQIDWRKRKRLQHEQAALVTEHSVQFRRIETDWNGQDPSRHPHSDSVSDTASADATADKSGPTIREIVLDKGFEVKFQQVVPDDEAAIKRIVREWSAAKVDWIITTGGTGFGVRDRTPEAITPLIERHASGLVHLLLSASLKITPLAALSRPVAGTIGDTLVVTLPGSVKAVKENLETLLSAGVLDHAIELIKGGSGKSIHFALSGHGQHGHSHGHSSHHHHDHGHGHSHETPRPRTLLSHDPSLPASARHRVSPYSLITYHDAMKSIFDEVRPLPTERRPVTTALKGYVLAEDVYAVQDVPSSPTTNVDGYAVSSTYKPGVYKVLTSATHSAFDPLPEGTIYRINTGAPLPAGTDAVIMVEDTRLVSSIKDEDGLEVEEQEVEMLVSVPAGENVRAAGSDIKKGHLALQKGEVLSSVGGEIGTLIFVGKKEVEVYRKPVVAILSTGNELLDIQKPVAEKGDGWGGIWDTNRPSLQAALEGLGYEVMDLGIVVDQVTAHVDKIKEGLKYDILLTTGGTSMGASDLLKPVIERHFNGTIHFGRVKIKPGKPTTFATIPDFTTQSSHPKIIFALPGNPASALVTFHVFVVPALRRLGGWPGSMCQYPRVRVKLTEAMRLDPRVEFHRVIIRAGADGLKVFSTGGQRSSRVASLSGANGLVVLPPLVPGQTERLEVGSEAEAMIIGELEMTR
ncbi:hypothetical protein EVG20_g4452 [Dentipellis fragilis]|uniref:MoaB/Mog domain-containing protein n=1 Tax=Dentipellis fragilis TaxID=205917 RepID=A0A4Y9YVM6_9AGAM|nr:hypothetical protein EVG20_g4452 [Dentipellis fragilis]